MGTTFLLLASVDILCSDRSKSLTSRQGNRCPLSCVYVYAKQRLELIEDAVEGLPPLPYRALADAPIRCLDEAGMAAPGPKHRRHPRRGPIPVQPGGVAGRGPKAAPMFTASVDRGRRCQEDALRHQQPPVPAASARHVPRWRPGPGLIGRNPGCSRLAWREWIPGGHVGYPPAMGGSKRISSPSETGESKPPSCRMLRPFRKMPISCTPSLDKSRPARCGRDMQQSSMTSRTVVP